MQIYRSSVIESIVPEAVNPSVQSVQKLRIYRMEGINLPLTDFCPLTDRLYATIVI